MRTTIILNTIWVILLSLLLMSCAPSPVYRISTIEEGADYSDGREYVSKEDNLAATSIEFDDQNKEHYVFYVQALNKDSEPIVFSPEEISITYLNSNMEPFFNWDKNYAVNPEKQIDNLNEEIKNRDTWHEATTGLNIMFGLFSVIADIADDDDRDDAYEIAEDVAIFTNNQVNEEIDYDVDMDNLNSEKEFWKNEVLRKTTLNQDEQIGGLIFLPFNEAAKFVKIEIPAGDKVHSYLYKQFRIN